MCLSVLLVCGVADAATRRRLREVGQGQAGRSFALDAAASARRADGNVPATVAA
jgi:hypothetical protein